MTAYQCYKFYLAIKLHFSSPTFDVFENGARVGGISEENFKTDRRFKTFYALSKKFSSPQPLIQYLVGCFAYGANVFDPSEALDASKKWTKHKEMSTHLILEELDTLSFDGLLEGPSCKLMRMLSGSTINIETVVALNRKLNFIETWKDNFTHPDLYLKIKKLDKFVKFNEEKVFSKIEEMENETTVLQKV